MSHEGEDYLIDYYSVLGIVMDVSQDEIAKAFREMQKKYHPDLYVHLAREFQLQAEARSRLLNDGLKILSDPVSRAAYDSKLSAWTGPISRDGIPVVDLRHRSRRHQYTDEQVLEGELQRDSQLILERTGFSPVIHDVLRAQMDSLVYPPESLKAAYRESLAKKDVYLSIAESFRKEALGLSPQTGGFSPNAALVAEVSAELDAGRAAIRHDVESVAFSLLSGEVPAIRDGMRSATFLADLAEDTTSAIEAWVEKTEQQFDRSAAKILELAREREELMAERAKLVTAEYRPDQSTFFRHLAVNISLGGADLWFPFKLEGDSEELTFNPDDSFNQDQLQELSDPEKADAFITQGWNILYLNLEEGIPMELALQQVLYAHVQRILI